MTPLDGRRFRRMGLVPDGNFLENNKNPVWAFIECMGRTASPS
jgi:hypothetical protein